jgi:glycosyltransferase involved in cell wall biosynthesis
MKVAIFQSRLPRYRINLFHHLRAACKEKGIELCVVYGQPSQFENARGDTGQLEWGIPVRNCFLHLAGKDIVWQPFPDVVRDCQLYIVMQENRLLSNYPLLLKRALGQIRLAYWGHGKNFQSNAPSGLRERWKSFLLTKVDWWFAYTSVTRDILLANGYPADRITVLDNAIDNERFATDLNTVDEGMLSHLRAELDLAAGAPLGLFCGSLYPTRRPVFMVNAADRIHKALPDFRFVVIGGGPSVDELRDLIADKPWAHWVGVRTGLEKAAYFRLASVILNPGVVGLGVLDAFCAGLPMFTILNLGHGPEIAYLQHGENGFILEDNLTRYGDAVLALLGDPPRLAAVRKHANASSRRFTLDNMVKNFVRGIEECLALPK